MTSLETHIADEIKRRIENDITYHNGMMPELTALAWHGYLAALLEWDLVSINEHKILIDLLPAANDGALEGIWLSREVE
jgi:hypothetical protein